jgi:serine/threonine protein kinase
VFAPGTVVNGRYEILGRLGQGGMGEVYRARRRLLGDEVAIKVVLARGGEAGDLRDRFLAESRTCAQLRHPNIVSILDFDFDADQRPFLVMELLSGPSLRDELRQRGRFSLDETQRLTSELAGAIQLAHDHGLVHRDLKPANIVRHQFESGESVYKVIDFGLANAQGGGETRVTEQRQFVGTATYASPEQLRGEPVDHRSDIYSLGGVVFELLTGRPPFPQDDLLALISLQLTAAPPRPSSLAPGVPAWVDEVVLRALAKDPNERWLWVSEFARALAGEPETGTTVTGGLPADALPSLEDYELERRLGAGRLGSENYLGRHRALGVPVVVRLVRREAAPNWDAVRARFVQEARALQVAHPSVLQVRDFGEEGDLMFLVTDYVEGESLRDLLAKEAPLAWPRLEPLVANLLGAAAALRRRGTGTCGLSPQIIRMTSDEQGERLVISSSGICQVQDVLGTLDEKTLRGAGSLDPELPYVAPELFLGRSPDARSDAFTLGVLMYEMATGRLPFQAANMLQLIGAAMSTRPIDPREFQPALPAAFADTVLRCLLADPAARPDGPAAILSELGPKSGETKSGSG